jgi:hypothetical protein
MGTAFSSIGFGSRNRRCFPLRRTGVDHDCSEDAAARVSIGRRDDGLFNGVRPPSGRGHRAKRRPLADVGDLVGEGLSCACPPGPAETRAELRQMAELIRHNDASTARGDRVVGRRRVLPVDGGGQRAVLAGLPVSSYAHRVHPMSRSRCMTRPSRRGVQRLLQAAAPQRR